MIDPQKTAFTNLLAIAFSGMMIYHSTLEYHVIACKIPLLARAFGMRAEAARPSARATIGYLVYKSRD